MAVWESGFGFNVLEVKGARSCNYGRSPAASAVLVTSDVTSSSDQIMSNASRVTRDLIQGDLRKFKFLHFFLNQLFFGA